MKESVPAGPCQTWLDELPAMLASPLPSLVKNSIRAGSMLFYGTKTCNFSIQAEARGCYARALHGLRCELVQRTVAKDSAASLNEGMVCAAVMLSHFETISSTSVGSWFQHVDGASMMLEILGPQYCRIGFMHQIFRHLRLLTVSAQLGQYIYND